VKSRIPPSRRVREELGRWLEDGREGDEEPLSTLVRLAAQLVGQELLEEEVRDYLERDHYERRRQSEAHRGYRNGYRPATLDTAEGRVRLEVPQLRNTPEPRQSRLAQFLRGNTEVLETLAVEMYSRGLSTRDIEDALTEATGARLLTRTAVSELTDRLWEEYEAFSQRDLSDLEVEYLFLDGVYEAMRPSGREREGILVAWAICRDGGKVLVHVALGSTESHEAWLDFLRDLKRRGLRDPVMVITDGAPGLIAAVLEVWPKSLRQRCLAHKMRNIIQKVPESGRQEVKMAVATSFRAPNADVAKILADDLVKRFGTPYPSAIKSFQDDLEACWSYLRCPAVHHPAIRTTNVAERAIEEERRRTKVIPRFFAEKSCLKLAFAALWQASCRWRGVRMSDIEVQQLIRLRAELGLSPPPPSERPSEQVSRAA
jgi:transposase-like protein